MPKSSPVPRLASAAAFLIGATMSLGMASSPVEESEILVSSDGVTFATSLSEGLFDDLALLVPTDSITSDLWIRNPTSAPATVRIRVDEVDLSSGAFADNLTLASLVERTGSTRAATLRELHGCDVIVAAENLPAHGTVKVRFTATLGDLPGVTGQNESVPIVLRIDMRKGQAAGFSPSPCEDATPTAGAAQSLARSGADPSIPLTAGGLLLSCGVLIILAGRRVRRSAR